MFKWFVDYQTNANQDKCHLIINENEKVSMHIGPFEIKNTNCEKLLGIKTDESRLKFNVHLDGIIKKASCKINALSKITPFMNIKRCILMNPFFNSHVNFCPLVWMLLKLFN